MYAWGLGFARWTACSVSHPVISHHDTDKASTQRGGLQDLLYHDENEIGARQTGV